MSPSTTVTHTKTKQTLVKKLHKHPISALKVTSRQGTQNTAQRGLPPAALGTAGTEGTGRGDVGEGDRGSQALPRERRRVQGLQRARRRFFTKPHACQPSGPRLPLLGTHRRAVKLYTHKKTRTGMFTPGLFLTGPDGKQPHGHGQRTRQTSSDLFTRQHRQRSNTTQRRHTRHHSLHVQAPP